MNNSERAGFSRDIRDIFSIPVIVAALGYFVDIYDLILFGIVRVQSLKDIGVEPSEILNQGIFLLDMQMGGMLLGGFLWGIIGDKKGRLKILFGSIFLYSAANIANAYVESTSGYAVWRFIAGIGLAGELGAGVTLVLESLPGGLRGYGTTIVATVGVMGAILANYIAKTFDWRMAYLIGGGLGMALLIMRIGVYESGMYKQIESSTISKGNFFMLFTNRERFLKYMKSIMIGLPIWFCVGILILLSPEFAKALNVSGTVSAGEAVTACYIGLAVGDFSSGFLSQYLSCRRKVVLLFLIFTSAAAAGYFMLGGVSSGFFYMFCGFIGFAVGYWALFITIAAEQFGTNIRATVASTVPNIIRGTLIPITAAFQFAKGYAGILRAGAIVGIVCLLIAFYAYYHLEETFDKDLDYVETN
ncbi:MFS transporter [Candidatus Magnetominusculus xianensis]|uniref:MFS transporter n=1 Tax=Candidatus Magnetominusculus xianensis TaxID=1748249 RepID=A0ABR5SJL2_9BACT|nr:MFS transporter [Candidatus Magnetominusculus xianensis]KWT85563.1 MFS transporter [Candidatus Magnetominusculus xianensis]MBF0404206.1 MFS transporter [Nitrospirota bacterium]